MQEFFGKFRLVLGFGGMLIAALPAFAGSKTVILPTGVNFAPQATGTVSAPQTVTVFNEGTTNFTIKSAISSIPEYAVSGTLPITVAPGAWANFSVTFSPDSAKSFTGTLTFDVSPATKVNLTGVGTSTTAVATLNTTSLTFASQSLGTTSPSQAVTISNTGTTSIHVKSVTLTYPFSQTGYSGKSTQINPGKSLTMQVTFFPTAIGVAYGTMLITYDVVPNAGLSISGVGAAATSLGVGIFPTLPSATQTAAYQATLTAVGGIPPYTWSLASGSTLPSGLSLSSSGTISGTLASTVGTGSYSFTAKATDSYSPPSTASALLTLPVYAPTNAECNNIFVDASDNSGLLIPINDLGTGDYLGAEEGGLYANGSNVRPSDHDSSGVSLAQGIQPLDGNGNPSPTGKYVLVSIGESIVQQSFTEFVALANADPSKNSNLVVVNAGTPGATASLLAVPNNEFWTVMTNDYLPNAGVTAKQVVAAWVNDVNGGPAGTFPSDMTNLQDNYESIAQNLLTTFPNIKLAYFSAMNYTGYSDGLKNLSHEPYSYESGFAVKNAIQDQINGNANLNFDPSKGPVLAPWIDWGPYYWANGLVARADGMVWTCQDLTGDGTHPSNPVGRAKVSTQLLNFLKTDDTASMWFLAPTAQNKAAKKY